MSTTELSGALAEPIDEGEPPSRIPRLRSWQHLDCHVVDSEYEGLVGKYLSQQDDESRTIDLVAEMNEQIAREQALYDYDNPPVKIAPSRWSRILSYLFKYSTH